MSDSTILPGKGPLGFGMALAGFFLLCTAEAPTAEITPVRFVEPNGLTVLVIEQHAVPIVHVQALVKGGSAQDSPEKAGLANLVGSLLDEGTHTRTARQIANAIDFVGGTLSVDTSQDYTMASARVLTKDQDLGFDLLADILRRPTFPEAELERVRTLVLGQILSELENPDRVASKAFHQLVFADHPYRWPVNGTETTVPGITRADVQGFHGREYLPNQTILAVVGDLTVKQARAQVRKFFGDWPRGDAPPRQTPAPTRLDRSVTQFIDRALTQATIMLGHLGVRRGHPDYYAISVMNYILGGGGFASRLMDTIRDKQGLAYGVFSAFDANLVSGAFAVSLQTRNETANQALQAVLAELEGMRHRPVTDQELMDAKAYLMGSFPLRLDTTQKLAEVLTLVEFFDLGLEYFTNYPKWIEAVTKEDVLRAARTYLHPDRYALVVVGNLAQAQVKLPPATP